jgi:hypothetical protein
MIALVAIGLTLGAFLLVGFALGYACKAYRIKQ